MPLQHWNLSLQDREDGFQWHKRAGETWKRFLSVSPSHSILTVNSQQSLRLQLLWELTFGIAGAFKPIRFSLGEKLRLEAAPRKIVAMKSHSLIASSFSLVLTELFNSANEIMKLKLSISFSTVMQTFREILIRSDPRIEFPFIAANPIRTATLNYGLASRPIEINCMKSSCLVSIGFVG